MEIFFVTRTVILSIIFLTISSVTVPDSSPALPCNRTACQLPECFCSTVEAPAGLQPKQIPQIVMLSFDDALTQRLYDSYYTDIFKHVNPDGCDIGVTFFLSHDYTDYYLVHDVWSKGHEIASHSITHQPPTQYWTTLNYTGWAEEMDGLRQIASHFANIPSEDIVGARAPFLQIAGDITMQTLHDLNFTWESSMPSRHFVNPALWPFTFEYANYLTEADCQIGPCPVNSYPGLWEVPLVDYNGTDDFPCAMIDTCTTGHTTDQVFNWFMKNFQPRYNGNRAPFGVFLHASWFLAADAHYGGYQKFINYINKLPDVYMVTVAKALEWIKHPTPLSQIKTFWNCTKPTSECDTHYRYSWPETAAGGERWMGTCLNERPPNYPWLGNPYGL